METPTVNEDATSPLGTPLTIALMAAIPVGNFEKTSFRSNESLMASVGMTFLPAHINNESTLLSECTLIRSSGGRKYKRLEKKPALAKRSDIMKLGG
jgi:hypothetical protein